MTIQGLVKEREKAKAEFKQAVEKGDTAMIASFSKSEISIMKIRVGNI